MIPDRDVIRKPLICLLALTGGLRPLKAVSILARYFGLSPGELAQYNHCGTNNCWYNRVSWVRNDLCNDDLIDRNIRGTWKLTTKGLTEAKSYPQSISDGIRQLLGGV